MITGSCLCGKVRFQADGEPADMSHCHCSMCRKAHGAAFATFVAMPADGFRYLSGEDAVVVYPSSPDLPRTFCRHCGSALPVVLEHSVEIPAGLLDGEPDIHALSHIFVADKAPWHDIVDDLPRHDAYEDPDAPVVERPSPGEPKPGIVRGSCLCGDVAFEVSTPFKVVYNCHCSRCRKARAAAFTTNGFTAFEGVRFTRGEDRIATFKLPGAKFFSHVFCTRCGSGLPRLDEARSIAIVPFGSLDDDPHRRPDAHIYVASAASWDKVAGDLPQFEEGPR